MQSSSRNKGADTVGQPGGHQRKPAGQRGDWAICCSGGGIRSASYCLGALQQLQASGLLGKAGLILSVSGGSYIASSWALVADRLARDDRKGDGGGGASPAGGTGRGAILPAYAPGSPEEENLRDNTHYLVPDAKTLLVAILSLLLGVTVTFIFVFAPLFVAAHAWGWLLRWQTVLCPGSAPQCGSSSDWQASVTALWWWLPSAVLGFLTLVAFACWWLVLAPRKKDHSDRGQTAAKWVGWAAWLTFLVAVAMLVVPLLLAWLTRLSAGPLATLVNDLGLASGGTWRPAALTGLLGAVIAVAQSLQRKLAKLHLPGAQAGGQAKGGSGVLATFTGWLRAYLLPWLAAGVIVLAGLVAGLRWVKDGAAAGYSTDQLWPVVGALVIVALTRVLADVNRISMHDFYRWRLASAYALNRNVGQRGGQAAQAASPVVFDPAARLSSLAGLTPKPVICATANINADRQVPVGLGGVSITFDPEQVILRGGDPAESATARTADYEALVGKHGTLFDVSAISGAAVSPLMGSMTRPAYRILLTMTNVRLGVWLPHPKVVAAARQELGEQAKKGKKGRLPGAVFRLLWYAFPLHPGWRRNTAKAERREARLWAYVLRMRYEHRRAGGVLYHGMQPTLGLLWAEAVGHTSYRSTWICVTDGGHYDNLGLVEALRRGAQNIVVLDAAGDKADSWFTLGGAIALARDDAGVSIDLDPTVMVRPAAAGKPGGQAGGESPAGPLRQGEVVQPWAHGTFARDPQWPGNVTPPNRRPLPATGSIWVCKLGWWRQAPWDIQAYAAAHSEFPGQSTAQQLYDGAEFDAYRELGASAVSAAEDGGLGSPAGPPDRRGTRMRLWLVRREQ